MDTMPPDELKKISVDTSSPVPPMRAKQSFSPKYILIPLGIVLVGIAVIGILLLPLRGVIAKGQAVAAIGRQTAVALKNQDLAATKDGLGKTRVAFTDLAAEYNKIMPLQYVPFLGSYVMDGSHAIKAGFAALDAADKAVEAIEPNADLLGFKKGGKFVLGTADERIQTAVKTMTALTPKINDMAKSIDIMRTELDMIDPSRYPDHIGSTSIRPRIASLKSTIEDAANLFVNAQPLLTNLPSILGQPNSKRYLIIFQNDKELRPTGGFITAYAQFRFDQGKMVLEKSDDIYSLDAAMTKKFPAPREILTFHKDVFNWYLRDSNLSPDFKKSMQQFESMYKYVPGTEKIDGIIALDTNVLVETLKILGPETIAGRVYSAETDKRCDCPGVIYELEDYSSRPVNYVRTDRKGEIGTLMQNLLHKALGVSPGKYWGSLFQMMIAEIQDKHILAYFHDPATQQGVESFDMGGRIQTASETASLFKYKEGQGWDYLHVNNSNMAGAKSNLFVSQKYTKDVTVNGDGTITTKLTVDYKNPYPGSDCNLERGGLCLNAPLRNWVRVYVPMGSKLVDSKGTQNPLNNTASTMTTYTDLGKTVFEGFLIVNPLGSAKLELTYTSPVKSTDGKYHVLIQKQPGTQGDQFILKLNGSERENVVLNTDMEFSL